MSKIKDLLAIEQGIEDLMPTPKPTVSQAADAAFAMVQPKAKRELKERATLEVSDDELGHVYYGVGNFYTICDDLAEDAGELYIESEMVDFTDKEYRELVDTVSRYLQDWLMDYASDVAADLADGANEYYKTYNERNGIC